MFVLRCQNVVHHWHQQLHERYQLVLLKQQSSTVLINSKLERHFVFRNPIKGTSPVRYVSDQKPLKEVFKMFKSSFSHLMIAVSFLDPITGERLQQSEIIKRRKEKDAAGLSKTRVTAHQSL